MAFGGWLAEILDSPIAGFSSSPFANRDNAV